jgi:serine/threonine-protein kinase
MVVVVGAVHQARPNHPLGRGDRRGAWRLALFLSLFGLSAFALRAHHVADPLAEGWLLVQWAVLTLADAASVWLVYIALEPFVRRRWPELIVSWSRLLAGDWRDPLVGRDVLIGATFGATALAVAVLHEHLGRLLGYSGLPRLIDLTVLNGAGEAIGILPGTLLSAVGAGLVLMFFLVLLTLVLRRRQFAIAAFFLIALSFFVLVPTTPLDRLFAIVPAILLTWATARFGLLTLVSMHAAIFHLEKYPLTLDLQAWYAPQAILGLTLIVAFASFGLHTCLGGQPLSSWTLLAEEE